MTSNTQLEQIYRLMFVKLSEISISDSFVKGLEENRSFTYVDKHDDYFFQKMVAVVFESGMRAWVWKKFEGEIRKEFSNYDVIKVASYTILDVDKMMKNRKMLRHRKKIEACIFNAKEIVKISSQYNGFWKWIDSETVKEEGLIFPKFELIKKVQNTFKWLTGINAYGFLKYVGVDVVKPDLNVRRIMYRLGLIESEKKGTKTYKQIQEVGKKIAKAVGERVINVEYIFYLYGSGGVQFFKYPICTKVPKCGECPLTSYCRYFTEVVSSR